MKIHINFSVLIGVLFFSGIAQGQTSYKKYIPKNSPFHIDTVFNKYDAGSTDNSTMNHIWLINLNGQYVDKTTKKINPSAVPAYESPSKNALLNPRSTVNQVIGAMLPYGYYFPAPATYTPGAYTPANRLYKNQSILYGYSQYSTGTTGAPHYNYIFPKF